MLGGRYHLVEPLALGGMASVWIADDPVLSRRVAVKILRDDLASDPATRTRFRNEAIAAARLNHPNVVATYDTGDDGGTAYIVMELIDGPTVRQLLQERGPLPVREVIRIGVQVADALEAAHRAGLVHRDVKPPNVLVPPAGTVKVTDFGIAKAAGGHDLTRTGTVMGTARYLAPEQVNGRPTDARPTCTRSASCSTRCSAAARRSVVTPTSPPRWRGSPRPRPRSVRSAPTCRRRSTTSCTGAWRATRRVDTRRRAQCGPRSLPFAAIRRCQRRAPLRPTPRPTSPPDAASAEGAATPTTATGAG